MQVLKIILIALFLMIAMPSIAKMPPRIAWLWPGTQGGGSSIIMQSAFKDGMRENGLVEGKHYILDERYAGGKYDQFPSLVNDLLKNNPAILMVNTIVSVRAAQQATNKIPIIFVSTNDPVGSGLVKSLSHPGGNTTGLSTQNEDVVDKLIELLREVLPRASRIAILSNPNNPSCPKMFNRVRHLLGNYGITPKLFEVTSPKDLDEVFSKIARYRPNAFLVLPEAMFYDQYKHISAFASKHKIPTIASQTEFVTSGCLISFSTNRREVFRRSAIYVKKILGGAQPGNLPVEQPTKFELAVNAKTAKALGITIPQSILLRADLLIQ